MPDTLHVQVPLSILPNGQLAVLEQNTASEVAQCVTVLLRTRREWWPDQPDMGIPNQVFLRDGPNITEIARQIDTYEPRAEAVVDDDPSMLADALAIVGVQLAGGDDR